MKIRGSGIRRVKCRRRCRTCRPPLVPCAEHSVFRFSKNRHRKGTPRVRPSGHSTRGLEGHCYRKLKIRRSDYPIIRYSDFCEIVYSSRTLLSEAHIGAADNRVYIRARTNIDEYRCTCIFGWVFFFECIRLQFTATSKRSRCSITYCFLT